MSQFDLSVSGEILSYTDEKGVCYESIGEGYFKPPTHLKGPNGELLLISEIDTSSDPLIYHKCCLTFGVMLNVVYQVISEIFSYRNWNEYDKATYEQCEELDNQLRERIGDRWCDHIEAKIIEIIREGHARSDIAFKLEEKWNGQYIKGE